MRFHDIIDIGLIDYRIPFSEFAFCEHFVTRICIHCVFQNFCVICMMMYSDSHHMLSTWYFVLLWKFLTYNLMKPSNGSYPLVYLTSLQWNHWPRLKWNLFFFIKCANKFIQSHLFNFPFSFLPKEMIWLMEEEKFKYDKHFHRKIL